MMDLTPVDYVASGIVAVAVSKEAIGTTLHLVNTEAIT